MIRVSPRYAELAAASNFSFLRGASHPEEMVARAAELGLTGLGVADRNTLAGVVRAHVFARENSAVLAGMRVVTGARLVFRDGTPDLLAYPGFHQLFFYGDFKKELLAYCRLDGMEPQVPS